MRMVALTRRLGTIRPKSGLEALKEPRLAAFLQQAPTRADETGGWVPLLADVRTDPGPTVSLFSGEKAQETPLVDAFWDLGWLRYG